MKSGFAVVLPVLLVAGMNFAAAASENIADYEYQAEIDLEGDATWYRAEIPVSVQWRASHVDLRDLRVFNAQGETLPFALTRRETHHTRKQQVAVARLFPLYADEVAPGGDDAALPDLVRDNGLRIRRDASGTVEIEVADTTQRLERAGAAAPAPQKILRGWLLDAGAPDFVPERLSLDWAGDKEGFFRFVIEGSNDLEHWFDWGQGQLVQLNFDGQSITQREIHLPRRKARYLRLLWQDAKQAPGVRGARFTGTVTDVGDVPFAWSPPIAGEAIPGSEGEFIWRFPLSLPLEQVSIVMDEPNTLAPVIFSGRDEPPPLPPTNASAAKGKPLVAEILHGERRVRDVLRGRRRERAQGQTREENPWRTLASGVVYRLLASTGEQVEETLALPGVPVRQLRLQVDPRGGGLGAKAPAIRLALRANDLTFLARGAGPYRLAIGRAEARAADLPLSALVPMDIEQAALSGRLGRAHVTETVSATVAANAPPTGETGGTGGGTGSSGIVLWAVLFAGVALLAGMVLSLLRGAKKEDGPGEE
ncbi:MAG: DUF3999 domain-containing protein [Azoarcus sp.]|jgi:hypothetical protein|nr:DUF3999 domain-containing protein [Azoarcus sp.]